MGNFMKRETIPPKPSEDIYRYEFELTNGQRDKLEDLVCALIGSEYWNDLSEEQYQEGKNLFRQFFWDL